MGVIFYRITKAGCEVRQVWCWKGERRDGSHPQIRPVCTLIHQKDCEALKQLNMHERRFLNMESPSLLEKRLGHGLLGSHKLDVSFFSLPLSSTLSHLVQFKLSTSSLLLFYIYKIGLNLKIFTQFNSPSPYLKLVNNLKRLCCLTKTLQTNNPPPKKSRSSGNYL